MSNTNSSTSRILITGSSGLIGQRLIQRLSGEYSIVGLDIVPPPHLPEGIVDWIPCDFGDAGSVDAAIDGYRRQFGETCVSAIHLAAYYDFSGESSERYGEVNVEGTRYLMESLRKLSLGQFIFASSLLVMAPSIDAAPLTEDSATQAEWDYPRSKLAAEEVVSQCRGDFPVVILRISGVYDEDCNSLPLSQQISRIHQKQLESMVFPGDSSAGQAFVHLDDLSDCVRQAILRRDELRSFEVFLIGEEDVLSYAELQERIGMLIHGKSWPTVRIPKLMAKAGAWLRGTMSFDSDSAPFIKPWMIDLADQHYAISIAKARALLDWTPQYSLRETLPEMIRRMQIDPDNWYTRNKIAIPEGSR